MQSNAMKWSVSGRGLVQPGPCPTHMPRGGHTWIWGGHHTQCEVVSSRPSDWVCQVGTSWCGSSWESPLTTHAGPQWAETSKRGTWAGEQTAHRGHADRHTHTHTHTHTYIHMHRHTNNILALGSGDDSDNPVGQGQASLYTSKTVP